MSDRFVLVTGAAGEMGAALITDLLADGWNVCGLDLKSPTDLEAQEFSFQECNLADGAETEKKIEIFHERFGPFDAVINCAGLIANSPLISLVDGKFAHHDFKLWDQILASCLSSAFHVTACTALKMASTGHKGVIINISSICSHGNPGQAAYSAAKAGLNGLTAALAKELGPMGIRVVALSPGYFDTASTRANVTDAKLKDIKRAVPLRRLGRLEEVTATVKFILANQYVNGRVIELDGGLVL